MMQRFRLTAFLIVAFTAAVLALSGSVIASTFKKSSNYSVTKLETINDDLYVWANRFQMQGVVVGDLSSFGYRIINQGNVTESANLFGREITHSGKVDGTFRAFGELVRIEGYVGRSALLFGREITLAGGSVVERDLSLFGDQIWLEGAVKGNLKGCAGRIELSGVIAGDVDIQADQIAIIKPAVILGKLTYTSENEAQIDLADGVTIAGGTTWLKPEKKDAEEAANDRYTELVLKISSLFAAFLFGIIVVRLFRPYAEESFEQLRTRFSVAVAAGLLGVVLLMLCVIVLVFALATMIAGMVVINTDAAPFGALILIFSLLMVPITSFLSITGAIVFYSGKIMVAFLIGYLIVGRIRQTSNPMSKSALFLGLLIAYGLFMLPYVGFTFYVIISIIGAGAIILGIKHCRKPLLEAPSTPGLPGNPPSPIPPPPPHGASGIA
jgi:cytoskeletal protein CcmA (bactofilin family)